MNCKLIQNVKLAIKTQKISLVRPKTFKSHRCHFSIRVFLTKTAKCQLEVFFTTVDLLQPNEYRRFLTQYNIPFDERYVWD